MTTLILSRPGSRKPRPTTPPPRPEPARLDRAYRQRDVGIGYGNSSGYASDRHYVRSWGQPRFRCY